MYIYICIYICMYVYIQQFLYFLFFCSGIYLSTSSVTCSETQHGKPRLCKRAEALRVDFFEKLHSDDRVDGYHHH